MTTATLFVSYKLRQHTTIPESTAVVERLSMENRIQSRCDWITRIWSVQPRCMHLSFTRAWEDWNICDAVLFHTCIFVGSSMNLVAFSWCTFAETKMIHVRAPFQRKNQIKFMSFYISCVIIIITRERDESIRLGKSGLWAHDYSQLQQRCAGRHNNKTQDININGTVSSTLPTNKILVSFFCVGFGIHSSVSASSGRCNNFTFTAFFLRCSYSRSSPKKIQSGGKGK